MNKPAATQAARNGQRHPPARDPAPEVGSWLHALLAFLLGWSRLFAAPDTPEARAFAQAIRELQSLAARHAAGDLPRSPARRHPPGRIRYARIPRAERRILLTPGLFAALYFTPRAAIAARARIAARAGQLATALRARSQTPISIFGQSAHMPTHVLFIPLT